jgi:hypothetical protein
MPDSRLASGAWMRANGLGSVHSPKVLEALHGPGRADSGHV